MKKYNVTINWKHGPKMLYSGVEAISHSKAKEKVRIDRVKRGDAMDIKSLSSELIVDWNKEHEKLFKHWIIE